MSTATIPRSLGRAARRFVVLLTTCLLATAASSPAPQDWSEPGADAAEELDAALRSVIGLNGVWSPVLSPDGRWLAYSVGSTEWEDNRFDREIWVAPADGEPYQLTRTAEGGSSGQEFSPDGRWLAFGADRGDGRQIWLIRPDGGEAWQVTSVETGVSSFAFAPDGGRIAFTSTDPETDRQEALGKGYGAWRVEDAEFRMSHLWVVEVADSAGGAEPAEPRRLTGGDEGNAEIGRAHV